MGVARVPMEKKSLGEPGIHGESLARLGRHQVPSGASIPHDAEQQFRSAQQHQWHQYHRRRAHQPFFASRHRGRWRRRRLRSRHRGKTRRGFHGPLWACRFPTPFLFGHGRIVRANGYQAQGRAGRNEFQRDSSGGATSNTHQVALQSRCVCRVAPFIRRASNAALTKTKQPFNLSGCHVR